MVNAPRVVAIVPARGGSKSIPRKNVRLFGARPLIAYSIAAALQSTRVERTIVSTDDEEIAAVARAWGADVPFLRPRELALDDTPDLPLFVHVLDWLRDHDGYEPDILVQVRPTSPLRPRGLVDAAVDRLVADPDADCVRTVVPSGQNPYKMWRPAPDGSMTPLLTVEGMPEPYNAARQSLPPVWWQTGHLDAFRRDTVRRQASLSGARLLPLDVPRPFCVDIDTDADWSHAEWVLHHGGLDVVVPVDGPAGPLPAVRPVAVILDFDGVLTDDRVWTDQDGRESVACSRADGLGLERLRAVGIPVVVLSRESNPVVAARCRKLGVEAHQSVLDKTPALQALLAAHGWRASDVIYVGNDVTDLGPLALVGCGVAVADAHPSVRTQARLVLTKPGGQGAVRELCDLILQLPERKTP